MATMFGMGMGEIILIAVVALLVVGPDRLPGAAKAIGKGIRDLRASTKDLQATIEQDTQIGEAVRELKGALRGDPASLYKRATGEDFHSPAKTTADGGSPESPSPDDDDHEYHEKASAEEEPRSEGDSAPSPDKELGRILDKAYANSNDPWGSEAHNPHEADEPPDEPSVDPGLPELRQPTGSVARAPKLEDSAEGGTDDGASDGDDDSSHG